jgi:hypothetical protein
MGKGNVSHWICHGIMGVLITHLIGNENGKILNEANSFKVGISAHTYPHTYTQTLTHKHKHTHMHTNTHNTNNANKNK